jgi:TetR/AcrR family transcriptional regulator, transcriptional repressor for nem operon
MSTAMTTKEKIVELGREFVQRIGYHAFKYQLIAQELNIKNAAIHHYFPNKEDLGLAIIQKDFAEFKAAVKSAQTQQLNPTRKLDILLNAYTGYFDKGYNLCVLGSCASAYSDLPERMRTAACEYITYLQEWAISVLIEGQQSGEFSFSSTPEELSALWCATLSGSLQTAKLKGKAYFDLVMGQLRKTLKA